jgi:mannosyltransferase OCH1-like enzyme
LDGKRKIEGRIIRRIKMRMRSGYGSIQAKTGSSTFEKIVKNVVVSKHILRKESPIASAVNTISDVAIFQHEHGQLFEATIGSIEMLECMRISQHPVAD